MPTFSLVFFLQIHSIIFPCVITITMMLRARMYKAVKKKLQEKTSMQLFGSASFVASIKSRTTVGTDVSNATTGRKISLRGFLLKKWNPCRQKYLQLQALEQDLKHLHLPLGHGPGRFRPALSSWTEQSRYNTLYGKESGYVLKVCSLGYYSLFKAFFNFIVYILPHAPHFKAKKRPTESSTYTHYMVASIFRSCTIQGSAT